MKKILAIGGAVIKTARKELIKVIEQDKVEMLVHNGGSIFHDFQIVVDPNLNSHSYPLNELLEDCECNREASELVWNWIRGWPAPIESVTELCEEKSIPVLLFTALGADFWHLFNDSWQDYAIQARLDFERLCFRFRQDNFHFINMGSAVIHPEVFVKAIAVAKPKKFRADVVDFLDAYRPRTRVARYGKYYKMTHKDFLRKII